MAKRINTGGLTTPQAELVSALGSEVRALHRARGVYKDAVAEWDEYRTTGEKKIGELREGLKALGLNPDEYTPTFEEEQ